MKNPNAGKLLSETPIGTVADCIDNNGALVRRHHGSGGQAHTVCSSLKPVHVAGRADQLVVVRLIAHPPARHKAAAIGVGWIIAGWLVFLIVLGLATCSASGDDLDRLIYAIGVVESNHDDNAVGDGGASIGRYQIQLACWKDAVEFDKTIGGRYEDVRDPVYAEKIMRAYWKRYARGSTDFETLARIHNGGPRGHLKKATEKYWKKVRAVLDGSNRSQTVARVRPSFEE